jgi:hypothetical protein
MNKHVLEVERAKAHYDDAQQIIFVTYEGELNGDVTLQVYEWLDELFKSVDATTIKGQIFDFRKVTSFQQDNLQAARRASNRFNMRMDTSHIPVALVIGDPYHDEIMRSGMRISPDHRRKKIVWSHDEAHEFLKEWHDDNPVE